MNLEIFKNSGFELRGGLINGEPFFVLADICKALNLTNPTEVAKTLNESTLGIIEVAINNRQVKVNAVSESGLYKVIFQSRKEEALQFQDWVTSEVLPSIRKNGIYATAPTLENMINNPDFAISLLTKLKEEQELIRIEKEKNQKLIIEAERNKPKLSFVATVESSINSVLIRDWCKSINLREKDVREWLRSKGYIYKNAHSKWRLSANETAKKYFEAVPTTQATTKGTFLEYTIKIKGEGQIALTDKILKDLSI